MDAGHSPADLRVIPCELVRVGPITVQRHKHEFAGILEALRDFFVHRVGNRAAAGMANDVDLVRLGRFKSGDQRVELAEGADAGIPIGVGPRAAWPGVDAELDAGLQLSGALPPFVHLFLSGLETAEENSTHAHWVNPPSGEAETSTVPSTEPWRLLARKSVQQYGCRRQSVSRKKRIDSSFFCLI